MQIRPRGKLTETSKHAKDTSIFNQVSMNSLLIMQIYKLDRRVNQQRFPSMPKDTRNCLAKFEVKII